MPMFTLHRKFTLRTTKGCVINFPKDEPTWVPPLAVEDAIAIGARLVDGEADIPGAEEEAAPVLSLAERKEKIFEAFGIMKSRNERLDFTASGLPNAKRLPPLTGFEVTSRERDDFWKEFKEQEQEAEEEAADAAAEAAAGDAVEV